MTTSVAFALAALYSMDVTKRTSSALLLPVQSICALLCKADAVTIVLVMRNTDWFQLDLLLVSAPC